MQRRRGNSACDIGPSRRGCARPSSWRCTRSDEFGWGGPVGRIEVTLRDIDAALPIVREVAVRTPTLPFHDARDRDVWLKLENLQRLGAFKIRGVWNRLPAPGGGGGGGGAAQAAPGTHG